MYLLLFCSLFGGFRGSFHLLFRSAKVLSEDVTSAKKTAQWWDFKKGKTKKFSVAVFLPRACLGYEQSKLETSNSENRSEEILPFL